MTSPSTPTFTPAIPAPPGVTPGQDLANNSQTAWIAASAVIIAIPTFLVPLRMYIKLKLLQQWKAADTICIIAWLLLIALVAVGFNLINYGVGYHSWDIPMSEYSGFAKNINTQQIIYMPAIFAAKAAVLLQLQHIFVTHRPSARWYIITILLAFNAVFFMILLFLEAFECTPRKKIWEPTIPGSCINIEQTFVATGSINVLDDLLILFLPIFWVWQLRTSVRTRIGIVFVFATGSFATICSIMRLAASILSIGSEDITSSLMPVSLWATAEVSSGIIVCCLPTLPRLFRNNAPSPSHIISDSADPNSQVGKYNPCWPKAEEKLLLTMDSQTQTSVNAEVDNTDAAERGIAGLSNEKNQSGESLRSPRPPKPAILKTMSVEQTSSRA